MSYLVEPQTNASVLAEILMQIDPAQHDAVYLMNQIFESQVINSKAILGLHKHSLESARTDNDFKEAIAKLAEKSLLHKIELGNLSDAVVSLAKLGLTNGLYAKQLHGAVELNATTGLKQLHTMIKDDIT